MGHNKFGKKSDSKNPINLSEEEILKIEHRPVVAARFMEVLFLNELSNIIYFSGNAYLKFLPIIQGIEFLGACEDNHPFEIYKKELPRKRFNRGLKHFKKVYHQFSGEGESPQISFFEDLRSPMVHQFRPDQKKIRLSDRSAISVEGNFHLSYDHEGRLILVLEDFYDDFAQAVKVVMKKIETGEINTAKLTDPHITIESIQDLIQTS